jgi:hypothetical protein
VDIAAFVDDGELIVVNGQGGELRARPARDGVPTVRAALTSSERDRWEIGGDLELLDIEHTDGVLTYGDYPDALMRLWWATACVNTGDVLVSAKAGWEFRDIGGSAHAGGSHGSLHVTDSTAPLISIGFDEPAHIDGLGTIRLTDIAPMIGAHLGLGATLQPR